LGWRRILVRRLGPRVSDGDREEKRDPRPLKAHLGELLEAG
jgi:hypothetical protein